MFCIIHYGSYSLLWNGCTALATLSAFKCTDFLSSFSEWQRLFLLKTPPGCRGEKKTGAQKIHEGVPVCKASLPDGLLQVLRAVFPIGRHPFAV